MEQYIKKSAIVAEIRKYIKSAEAFLKYHHNKKDRLCYSLEHQRLTMCELLSFIDTLEVKEVDLEKELKEDWLLADKTEVDCLESMCLTEDMFVSLAKKYFQLGLKTQKGE